MAQLLQYGWLRASVVPTPAVRQWRDLTRHRSKRSEQHPAGVNRVHKTLEEADSQLGAVLSDIMGVSGRRRRRAIAAGQEDAVALAALGQDRPESVIGLNHAQFRCNTLGDTLDRYERLKAVGIVPERKVNHGPGTSFYYRDPDGNAMEMSGRNFTIEAEARVYMQSDAFQRNPRGVAIDPDDFVAKFRNGMPQAELVRIP